jgi:hypothetical protein
MGQDMQTDGLLDLNSDRTRRACAWIVAGFVVLGAIGRLKQYIARPSYWNDEAAVVANVIHRDWRQLLDRLDYAQAAPPLFLWAERALYKTLGPGEYSLRLLPLFFGLLVLPLYAKLAWRTLPPTSACWATGFFSLFQKILHHAPDVKQYSGDLCVGVVLLLIAFGKKKSSDPLSPGTPGERGQRRMIPLSIAAALLLWLSFPVVFLFGALSLVLLLDCIREGMKSLVIWCAGGALVLASFLVLHRVALSHGADPSLIEFWHESFPDFSGPIAFARWLGREVYGLFAYPFDSLGAFTTILAVLGSIALVKLKKMRLLMVLPTALGLAFVAAAFHQYPFPGRHRLGLYLVPMALFIEGAGAEGQNLKAKPWLCRWWWLLPGPLLLMEVGQLAKDLVIREEESTMRPVVEYVRAARQPDEPIYLFGDSLSYAPASGRSAEFLCYWPDAPGKVVVGYAEPSSIHENRFWLVYSLNRPEDAKPPLKPFKRQLLDLFPGVHLVKSVEPRRQSGAMLVERDSQLKR